MIMLHSESIEMDLRRYGAHVDKFALPPAQPRYAGYATATARCLCGDRVTSWSSQDQNETQ